MSDAIRRRGISRPPGVSHEVATSLAHRPPPTAEVSTSGHAGRCAISNDSQLHIMLREHTLESVVERDSIGDHPGGGWWSRGDI
jgi:hypothetical protein